MTLSDIMKACARAYRLAPTDRERAGVERATAAILDAFDIPNSQRFAALRLAKGSPDHA